MLEGATKRLAQHNYLDTMLVTKVDVCVKLNMCLLFDVHQLGEKVFGSIEFVQIIRVL